MREWLIVTGPGAPLWRKTPDEKFDKKKWQREYMRDYRNGKRRDRAKAKGQPK